jgi:hypothetical protein
MSLFVRVCFDSPTRCGMSIGSCIYPISSNVSKRHVATVMLSIYRAEDRVRHDVERCSPSVSVSTVYLGDGYPLTFCKK